MLCHTSDRHEAFHLYAFGCVDSTTMVDRTFSHTPRMSTICAFVERDSQDAQTTESMWIDQTSVEEEEQLTVTSVSLLFNGLGKDEESSRSIMNAADRVEITVIVVLYCSATASLPSSSLICRFSSRKSSANHRTEKAIPSPIRERLLSARSFFVSHPALDDPNASHSMNIQDMQSDLWTPFESKEVCLEANQEELMIEASMLLSNVDHWLNEKNEVRTYAFREQEMSLLLLLLLSECWFEHLNLDERFLIVQVDERSIEWRKLFLLSAAWCFDPFGLLKINVYVLNQLSLT